MRGDDERRYPPGVVPGAVGALGAIAASVLVVGVVFGLLLANCSRAEPIQMIPTPKASSTAIATSSAQAVATQSVRVTVRRVASNTRQIPDASNKALSQDPILQESPDASNKGDQGEEIVIEVSQGIAASATSSAQASASVAPEVKVTDSRPLEHGRLGVIASTMPGILAADVELARVDVPPWLVGVPLEVGLDVAGNLEAGAAGVSVGGKAFAVGGAWSRWSLTDRGLFLGAGLRF